MRISFNRTWLCLINEFPCVEAVAATCIDEQPAKGTERHARSQYFTKAIMYW